MRKHLEEYLDFVTMPLLIVTLVYVDAVRLVTQPVLWFSAACFGFLLWTFAEYAVHRFVLHAPSVYLKSHQPHHARPNVITRFPLWWVPAYGMCIGTGCAVLFGENWVAVLEGIVIGYTTMINVHHDAHQEEGAPATRAATDHRIHHTAHQYNYGVSVNWWDKLFGTYKEELTKMTR